MWWTVAKEAATNWSGHKDARQGAALAYYSVFSLGPIIVIAIAVAGLLFGHDAVRSQVMSSIREMLGDTGGKAVEAMLAGASRPAAGILATILGIGALLFAAIGVVVQLKDALNVVWEVEESEESGLWHFARNYVLSFAAILALGFLLLVSLLVSAGLAAAGKYAAIARGSAARRQHADFVSRRHGTIRDDVQVAAGRLRRLAGRLAGRLPHGPVLRDRKGGDRRLHWKARPGIDLRCGRLDRRLADLGLLHVADHPDGRGDHPQLREAQRFSEAARPTAHW
jgi:Virulence factor BrkB